MIQLFRYAVRFCVWLPVPRVSFMFWWQDVFSLFVSTLHGLSARNASFSMCFDLLERLACVNAFVLCAEISGGVEIVNDLVQCAFDVLR